MLSYQHAYHAGNFADLIKHSCQSRILSYMLSKDKPLLYMETHAGRGLYALKSKEALKTQEAESGVALLWQNRAKAPAVLAPYLDILQALNPQGQLEKYPGSPYIAQSLLRDIDRQSYSELHPREFEALNALPKEGKRRHCWERDGIEALKAELPPIERRAFILIDPSYEIKNEYRSIPKAIQEAAKRFETGVYCLWYPILESYTHGQLLRGLEGIPSNKKLRIEFYLNQPEQPGMQSTGLWILNPPYGLKEEMRVILNYFKTILNPGKSSYLLE